MHLLSAILFAISANIDNLTIGLAYGIQGITIGKAGNLVITSISCVGTFLSIWAGSLMVSLIPASTANTIGCILLILMGMWLVLGHFLRNRNVSAAGQDDPDSTKPEYAETAAGIGLRESVALAIALSLNNVSLGFGAGIAGLNLFLTTVCTFFFSLCLLSLGQFIGKSYLSLVFGRYAVLVSGLIIMCLGCYELFI